MLMMLEEICNILCNNKISTKDASNEGDLNFVHPKHLNIDGSIDSKNCLKISSSNELIKQTVQINDIIIVILGGLTGKIFKSNEAKEFVTGQTCAILKSNDSTLYDKLLSKEEEINGMITGAAIKMISLSNLKKLEL